MFLFPAFVLIFFMLAAIAADLSLLFLAERDAADAAISAASAGATALDEETFRSSGTVTLDADEARRRAGEAFDADRINRTLLEPNARIVVVGPNISVSVRGRARPIFVSMFRIPNDLFVVESTATANPEGPPA